MFSVKKSFRLLRLLNQQPKPPVRMAIALVSWLGMISITARITLANGVFRLIWSEGDLKRGMRRIAWFAERSWVPVNLPPDQLFDVSEEMTSEEIASTEAFLARSSGASAQRDLDLLTLKAAALHPPVVASDWLAGMEDFRQIADRILQGTATPSALTAVNQTSSAGDFRTDAAALALIDFADLFPNSEIPWFLVSGTFLGTVREGGFLPHDFDIDLGVRDDISLDDMAASAHSDPRFSVIGMTDQVLLEPTIDGMGSKSSQVLLKLLHRDGVHIDVFAHFLDGEELWHGSQLHRWDNKDFELIPYTLAGIEVFGAKDADLYLTENYGDWRTPRTSFNPSTGTPSLRLVHNLASIVLFLKRIAIARQTDASASDRLIAQMEEQGYVTRSNGKPCFSLARFQPAMDAELRVD